MSQDKQQPRINQPGVYVQETGPGPGSIIAAPTANAIFLGETESGEPGATRAVTSWADYQRHFGGFAWGLQTPFAVYAFFQQGGDYAYVSRAARPGVGAAHTLAAPIAIRAASPGVWGNRLALQITNSPIETPPEEDEKPVFTLHVLYRVPNAAEAGTMDAKILDFADRNQISEERIDGVAYRRLESLAGFTAADLDKPDADTPCPLEQRFNATSLFARVKCSVDAGARPKNVIEPQAFTDGLGDHETAPVDYGGALARLDEITDAALLLCPEISNGENLRIMRDEANLVLTYCENRPGRDLFAVLDAPYGLTPQEIAAFKTGAAVRDAPAGDALTSSYGAIYYPWLYVFDPAGAKEVPVSPGGAMAGAYAAADASVGPWQAAAGTVAGELSVATGLERNVDDAEQGLLNPEGVNVIRTFPTYGILAWGARTLSPDPDDCYVPARRTLIMIETSLRQGLAWTVFEPNDANTRAAVATATTSFLNSLYVDGAMPGATADEAYAVVCDDNNNRAGDIAAGRLNLDVFVALVRPAEFTIIRLQFQSAAAPAD
jgi:phage tail sheath protein FI